MPDVRVEVPCAASAATVWSHIGDFARPEWIRGVRRVDVHGEGVGARRTLHMADGAAPVEILEALSDRAYTYRMPDDVPLPVRDFRSTLSVEARGEGAVVVWQSHFEMEAGAHPSSVSAHLRQLYQASLYGVLRPLSEG